LDNAIIDKGTNFIWSNARLLERVIFEYAFFKGSSARILSALRAYHNDDGGFGHALEPDLRAPDSHPLFIEFGMRTLHICQIRDTAITRSVCEFLAIHADLVHGIPTLFPSSQHYPRAPHWNTPSAELPSWDRFAGIIGLVNWQGISDPWLQQAVQSCVDRFATTTFEDAHTILTAFCLLESIPDGSQKNELFKKLAKDLLQADFFSADAPVRGYSLTPLDFAPTPSSYCRSLFSVEQLETHSVDLASTQDIDGGWPITWEPPSEAATWEWRACRTVNALMTLRAYGKV
jgi:hypothetical protein